MIREVALREHGRARNVALNPEQVRALLRSPARLTVTAGEAEGVFDIGASEVVGSFETAGLRLQIAPKVSVGRLCELLEFAERVQILPRTELGEAQDLAAMMAEAYARALDEALRGGPIREYVQRSDDLPAVRGRIDVNAFALRRFQVVPPIPCAFPEFTADVPANSLLLAAATRLRRVSVGSPSAQRAISRYEQMLFDEGVTPAASAAGVPNRRFEHYSRALSLAELILRNLSFELHGGHTRSAGFLVDMNALFEAFVIESLRMQLRLSSATWRAKPPGLTLDGRTTIEPDIIWRGSAGMPLLVLDAKYKDAPAGALNSDLYQMLAYCTALKLKRGVLIYAASRDAEHEVLNSDVRIHVVSLDLGGSMSEVRARVAALAEKLRGLAP